MAPASGGKSFHARPMKVLIDAAIAVAMAAAVVIFRSEEHTSELQSLV